MKTVKLNIEGMKCSGCVNRINNVLSTIKGITSKDISLEEKTLLLEVKNDKVLEEAIKKIEDLDFKVTKL